LGLIRFVRPAQWKCNLENFICRFSKSLLSKSGFSFRILGTDSPYIYRAFNLEAFAQPDDQHHFTSREKSEKTPMKSPISLSGTG
jgi:hypothetical protein